MWTFRCSIKIQAGLQHLNVQQWVCVRLFMPLIDWWKTSYSNKEPFCPHEWFDYTRNNNYLFFRKEVEVMPQPISTEQPPKLKIKFNRRRRRRKGSFFHGRNLLFPRRKSCPRARLRYHLSGSPLTQESTQHLYRGRRERKCNHIRSRRDWEIHIWAPECVWRTETLFMFIT